MKTLKRVISALMAFVLLCTMLPVQAFAAEEEAVAELRFYSDCTIDAYTVVSVGKDHKLTFNLGKNPYKFAAKFDNPDEIGHVFVSSTVEGKTKKLKAEYNEKTGLFETEGYFDPENKYYEPCNIRVEYAPKTSVPAVGSKVDWDVLMEHIGADLQGSTVTNTNEGGSSYGQLELAGELAGVTLDYLLEELEPEVLSELRNEYNSQSGIAAYIVPGLDDEKYYAYLDMSDPSTYIMFLDDGLDVGSKAVSLKLDMMEQGVGDYSKLSEVSQGLSNVSTVVGFVGDAYNITKDMDQLRYEVETMDFEKPEEKQAAMDKVDALEADQIVFALLVTVLPIIATGGGASPAASAIFSGIIGVMSAASDTIYEHRIGMLKDKQAQAQFESDTVGGKCTDTIRWEVSKSAKSATISGTGPMPDYTLAGKEYWCTAPWYNVYKISNLPGVIGNDKWYPVETVSVEGGITYIGACTFWNRVKEVNIASGASIGTEAFRDCDYLTHIRIPEGVETISDGAFRDCGNLESVILPTSLTYLGNPFTNCPSMAGIRYEGNVTQWESISGWMNVDPFRYGQEPSDHIPYTVQLTPSGSLGDNLVWHYDGSSGTLILSGQGEMASVLKRDPVRGDGYWIAGQPWARYREMIQRIELEEGITGIVGRGFEGHTALTEILFPDSLTSIGSDAFTNCTSLKEMTIPKTVSCGVAMFDGCSALEKVVVNGSAERLIFRDCAALTSVMYPDNIKAIGFENCGSLKNLEIPQGVTDIDIFENCPSLESITIPATVANATFHEGLFAGCSALKDIYYGSSQSSWESTIGNSISTEILNNVTVHFAAAGLCGKDMSWSFDQSSGILHIQGTGNMNDYSWDSAPWHEYASEITQVVLSEGITSIGSGAFGAANGSDSTYGNLTAIELPKTLQTIGDSAFEACPALPSIDIPEGVTFIGGKAFAGNKLISGIDLPDTVEYLGEGVFKNCTSLKEITLSKILKTIDNEAFFGCTALASLKIPDSVEEIGKSAFANCTALTDASLPASLNGIPGKLFENCASLTKINIPASIEWTSDYAFRGCSALKQILFQGEVPTYGLASNTFAGVVADVYYPANSTTWTEEYRQNYGGNLVWHTDGNMEESGLTEQYIQDQIDAGATEIFLTGFVNLANDYTLPKGITLYLSPSASLTVPEGKTLTVAGRLYIWQGNSWEGNCHTVVKKGGVLEVAESGTIGLCNMGNSLVVEEGGLLKLNGELSAENAALIDMKGNYEIGMDNSGKPRHVIVHHADPDGFGDMPVITGIDQKDLSLARTVEKAEHWEEVAAELNQPEYGSYQIQLNSPITITGAVTIPKWSEISAYGEDKAIQIAADGVLTNYGSVSGYMKNSGTIENYGTMMISGGTNDGTYDVSGYIFIYADMTNPGTMNVHAGGNVNIGNQCQVTNTGAVTVNQSGTLSVDGTFRNDGDVVVNAGGTVYVADTPWSKGTWLGNAPVNKEEPHTHSYTDTVVPPTCTEQGYTVHICPCGDSYKDTDVDALGHHYDEGKVTTQPGCNSEGVKTFTCSRDTSHTYTESIPAVGHSFGDWYVTKEATTEECGEERRDCANCGEAETRITDKLPGEGTHEFSLGDVNHDGKINAKDATLILQKSVGVLKETAKFCENCAEVSGDGKLNAKDSTLILQFSVGLRDNFPAQ